MATDPPLMLDQLSPELITRIVYFVDYDDLKQLRLTNRSLDAYARRELFHGIFLSTMRNTSRAWNNVVNSDELRYLPRKATLQPSETIDPEEDIDDYEYDSDEDDDFPKGVRALESLSNVSSVQINFMPQCVGETNEDQYWRDPFQSIEDRTKILELIFGTLQRRATNSKDATAVAELTLQNLQNCPIEFASSDLFASVMGQLEHLHIAITQEYTDSGPDHDYSCKELWTFPPHLVSKWLSPISQNLRTLSLYSASENWGPFPGYYDLSGISFPRLETLSLGYYTIAYDDQLDWVLAQKSLKRLVMQSCMIVRDIRIYRDSARRWDVSTRNWEVAPDTEEQLRAIKARYSGRWSQLFDKIAEGLPNLETFCFDYAEGCEYSVNRRHLAELQVHPQRYVVFDEGILPTRWPEASDDGKLRYTFWKDKSMIRNFHEDHLQEDEQSLERLTQKCRERRGI